MSRPPSSVPRKTRSAAEIGKDSAMAMNSDSAPVGSGGEAEISYLGTVEAALLQEIHVLQKTLNSSRAKHAFPVTRRASRRSPSSPTSPSALSPPPPPASSGVRPRHRVISVSLRLPTKSDRESVRQQLFDFAVAPKGMFSLDAASPLQFIWVGLADGPKADSSAFDTKYGPKRGLRSMGSRGPQMSRTGQSHLVPVPNQEGPELLQKLLDFSEDTLYRILHYDYSSVLSDVDGEVDENWAVYKQMNQQFAQTVSEIYEDGDLVWVHNHHLMLLPGMIRERLWYAKVGFFLYTPFPSAELFRILPYRTELLRGVLGADLVGFYSYDYSKQFVSSCTQLLGLDGTPSSIEADPRAGRKCEIGIYPAGIDVKALKAHVSSKSVKTRVAELREQFAHRKVIVGVNRLDDAFAGIPLTLLAFEKLLEEYPEYFGRVVLVQVAMLPSASRGHVSCRAQGSQINEIVARINASFGTLTFSPVHYITAELDPAELHALMCVGHVCVVSKVRDGMGLVPHEWTVCQHGNYKGPIVLSEFSGSARSFSTALHVNPWDVDDVALKMKEGLEMDDKAREVQNDAAYQFATKHTAAMWGFNFLEDLEMVKGAEHGAGFVATPLLDTISVIKAYKAASSLSALPSPIPSCTTLPALGSFGASSGPSHSQQFAGSFGADGVHMYSARGPLGMSPPSISAGYLGLHGIRADASWKREKPAGPSDSDAALGSGSGTSSSTSLVGSASAPQGTPAAVPKVGNKKKLFILDYEGTLAQFQPLPEASAPHSSVKTVIANILEACEDNCVLILSGRDKRALAEWFGDLDVFLAAEDGCFLRQPGDTTWVPLFLKGAKFDTGRRAVLAPADSFSDLVSMRVPPADFQPLTRSIVDIVSDDLFAKEKLNGHGGDQKTGTEEKANGPALERGMTSGPHKGSASSLGSFHGNDSADAEEEIAKWKEPVKQVMSHFAERTPGALLEEGDATLTWHYVDTDQTFGRSQARDLHKHLESFLLHNLKIEVVAEEGKNRWIKVHPVGVNKADAVFRTIESVRDFGGRTTVGDDIGQPRIDFILCVGDDRADECMFDLLREEHSRCELGINTIGNRIFTVRVGSNATGAMSSLDTPQQVVDLLDVLIKKSHGTASE